jgi:hypothetical protein
MKKSISVIFLILFLTFKGHAQISEAGSLGLGIAYTSLNYGVSAKYNFTEVHTGQVIVGSANFGYNFGNEKSFSLTGRYSYNFEEGDIDFAIWKPYLYGQVGYWTYKYSIPGFSSFNYNAVAIGAGGGVEWSFQDFVDGLAFSFELGFTSISFEGLGSIGGFNGGFGIHYYFNL